MCTRTLEADPMENFAPREGYLLVMCAWCGMPLRQVWEGTDRASPYGNISHGICPPCEARVCKDLRERRGRGVPSAAG